MEKCWRSAGKPDIADKFKGYDWKTEEDAFMDGHHQHAGGGEFVTFGADRCLTRSGRYTPRGEEAIGLAHSTGQLSRAGACDQPPVSIRSG